jgi:antitoxin component YwqK of YwqJK toxin-antitoxin module
MRKFRPHYLVAYSFMISFAILAEGRALAYNGVLGDSTFKSWYFTPTGVYGRIPLTKLTNRSYVKISRKNNGHVIVYDCNPAAVVEKTTDIEFTNGQLSLMTSTNRWNESLDTMWFKPSGVNEFFVFEKSKGHNPQSPCQALRFIFKNNLIRDIYCMMDSNKTGYNKEGVAHYSFDRYDDPKRFALIKSESYFGDIDNPVISRKSDCHKIINEFDENANLVSNALFGVNDEPVTDRNGNSRRKINYDKNDNQTEIEYFDAKGFPWNDYLGCARHAFDIKNGFIDKETFNQSDYTLTRSMRTVDSVAVIKYLRDKNGDETEKTFFDEQYLPINNPRGIHRSVYGYGSPGMLTDITFFDKDGSNATDEFGVHHYHFERNSIGQMVITTQFNSQNMPLMDFGNGAYETKLRYDNWGRMVSNSCWVNDSVKMTTRMGYHELSFAYDPAGMISRIEFYDKDGKSNSADRGYSIQLFTYNEQEQVAERKYLDGNKPVMLRDTNQSVSLFHSIQYSYDFSGRVRSLEYFDDGGMGVNSRVTLGANYRFHPHKVEFTYGGTQIVSERLYDLNNTALTTLDCQTDNCLLPSGTSILIRKSPGTNRFRSKRSSFQGIIVRDSMFFANQLAFLNQDSLLLFLNSWGNRLSDQSCATFYRLARVNKYYQFTGEAADYYLDNDKLAARLRYDSGHLNGACTYYYRNGNIRERGTYRNDQRTGPWEYFYEDGMKSKAINFTNNGPVLTDCFAPNGSVLVQNGNGHFAGTVLLGNLNNNQYYTVTGDIKEGVQDGEWKMYYNHVTNPSYTEIFSEGKFVKGTTHVKTYNQDPRSSFESIHPQDRVDHYGQDVYCAIPGRGDTSKQNATVVGSLVKNYYHEIQMGMVKILQTNKFGDYSGWIFLWMYYDEEGLLRNKYVRLFRQNDAFREAIQKMLDGFSGQLPIRIDNKNRAFEKFYVILVEGNQMVIPEQILENARSDSIFR